MCVKGSQKSAEHDNITSTMQNKTEQYVYFMRYTVNYSIRCIYLSPNTKHSTRVNKKKLMYLWNNINAEGILDEYLITNKSIQLKSTKIHTRQDMTSVLPILNPNI